MSDMTIYKKKYVMLYYITLYCILYYIVLYNIILHHITYYITLYNMYMQLLPPAGQTASSQLPATLWLVPDQRIGSSGYMQQGSGRDLLMTNRSGLGALPRQRRTAHEQAAAMLTG